MNKKYIINSNEEIQKIISKGTKKVDKYFIIYNVKNSLEYNRYCVSISKKIGNAVVRNKEKRVIKEILRKSNINSQKNYVIILRKEILSLSFIEKEKELINLIKGEKNE